MASEPIFPSVSSRISFIDETDSVLMVCPSSPRSLNTIGFVFVNPNASRISISLMSAVSNIVITVPYLRV